jgi:nicotinamide-nucleotide amidase
MGSMSTDEELLALSARVGRTLKAAGRTAVTAESCTGGWVAKSLTDVAGSSAWFECGFVTYSDDAKVRDLGVPSSVLQKHGAVSEQTALEMARGALRVSNAGVALAITGIAGPSGGSREKPVGTVWFAVAHRVGRSIRAEAERKRFDGDRDAVRRKSVKHALRMILSAVSIPRAASVTSRRK